MVRVSDGETAHEQEEVPGLAERSYGVAANPPMPAAELAGKDVGRKTAGLLELLRSDRQFEESEALLERSAKALLAMAQPAQPASELSASGFSGEVRELGFARIKNCGRPESTTSDVTQVRRIIDWRRFIRG